MLERDRPKPAYNGGNRGCPWKKKSKPPTGNVCAKAFRLETRSAASPPPFVAPCATNGFVMPTPKTRNGTRVWKQPPARLIGRALWPHSSPCPDLVRRGSSRDSLNL